VALNVAFLFFDFARKERGLDSSSKVIQARRNLIQFPFLILKMLRGSSEQKKNIKPPKQDYISFSDSVARFKWPVKWCEKVSSDAVLMQIFQICNSILNQLLIEHFQKSCNINVRLSWVIFYRYQCISLFFWLYLFRLI